MKSVIKIVCIYFFLFSCNSDKKKTEKDIDKNKLSIAEKIANAHGYENWKDVKEINFTFQVDRDTIKGNGRSWKWKPQENIVQMKAGVQDITYNRSNLDSIPKNVDRAFINDKYWTFIPFQLVWDTNATISEPKVAEAPISKTQMSSITILYPEEGGYTPGDAYDMYYDDDYIIREWTFRKGNAEEPSLSTTLENYKDYNGIKIATEHKQNGNKWNLRITDIKVKTE